MRPDQLFDWRDRNGYSIRRLAKKLGVGPASIYRWEAGLTRIPEYLGYALMYIESHPNGKALKNYKRSVTAPMRV